MLESSKSKCPNVVSTMRCAALRRSALLGVLVVAGLAVLGGCRTSAQNGALIGAGVGAAGGYIIGNEHDKK